MGKTGERLLLDENPRLWVTPKNRAGELNAFNGNAFHPKHAESWLRETWESVAHRHPTEAAHAYVRAHWPRYRHVLSSLPPWASQAKVLEIGASIVASALRLAGAEVSVAYHELEPEWNARFREEGIQALAVELLRDALPWPKESFDLILCDQVLEHLPLDGAFLVRQMLWLLKPGGMLYLSTPNFAAWEKRKRLLLGGNPQDTLDPSRIYYAHHREPVMAELKALVAQNGGIVLDAHWVDFAPTDSGDSAARWVLPRLRAEFAAFMHRLFPAMRDYLVIKAGRVESQAGIGAEDRFPEISRRPPLADSKELARYS